MSKRKRWYKNPWIIGGGILILLIILAAIGSLLTITGENKKLLVPFINAGDGSTVFKNRNGTADKVTTTVDLVETNLYQEFNKDAEINQKPYAEHHASGYLILIDDKVVARHEGSYTQSGWEGLWINGITNPCNDYTNPTTICGSIPLEHQDCQNMLIRSSCVNLFSDDWIAKQNNIIGKMIEEEMTNLTGCHKVKGFIGQKYWHGGGSPDGHPLDLGEVYAEHETVICFEQEPPIVQPIPCSYEFKPVCSKTGQTFTNQCVMESQGQKLDCEKECPCVTPLPPVDDNWFEKMIDWITGLFGGD